MTSSRQLAAIMFTDIVGYTALMGEDEQMAFDLLRKNRQTQQPLIKQYNGTWIKEIGDGLLATFQTVTDAVKCASAIQSACNHIPDLKLRIGIHLGEVVFENNDVFGEGVNIASRIQALASIGGICVSEHVYKNIANKKDIKATYVGAEVLKNVKDPVQIYEVQMNDIIIVERESGTNNAIHPEAPAKSVAVLPFVNMSSDPEQEYFSDGIAEEILNSLVHLKGLKVAGRTSSFRFKGKNLDLREIGEQLGVSNVLEGSLRKQGNKLRVTAQLVNVKDGFHLWSERYDQDIDDIFAIQDEIALAITEKLKVTLLKDDRDKITKTYTQNTKAYDLYLKGRFFINRRGASIMTGIQCFQQAIDIDPDFALAYAGYADAISLTASFGFVKPTNVMNKVKHSAEKAIQLDPHLSEPYCSLAFYYNFFEWNWKEARRNFLKSIELNPRYAQAHYWYGWDYLAWVEGNFDEAEKHGQIAIQLEPLNSICYGAYSQILHKAGKFKEALAVCKTGIELDANSYLCRFNEGVEYMSLQQYDEAISSFENAMQISNRHHLALNCLLWTHCLKGNFEKASALMKELKERSQKEYVANTFTGISAAYLNDVDEAFKYLEAAYNDREPILLSLRNGHWVPPTLTNDPRYKQLIDRIGYPEYVKGSIGIL
ncbi:MAG: adenylate/guanylate cyclase domain-containing protein [Chitinophagaceae bacterium]